MIKLLIAGGRDFNNINAMIDWINQLEEWDVLQTNDMEIVSGMARGADSQAVDIARSNNIPLIDFPANWDKYGRRAGYLRNEQMGAYADVALIFWDGESRGTKHMIECMRTLGKPVYEVNYSNQSSDHLSFCYDAKFHNK